MSHAPTVTLTLANAAFGYGRKAVVRNLDASFRAGVITAILGNNGAGKSTLLKGLLALTPCLEGSVRLDGEEVGALAANVRARKLAYLEQQASCHWPMSAARVVALGRAPHGEHGHVLLARPREVAGAPRKETPRAAADAIRNAMAITDTTGLADRAVTRLSGGERARVMLARALATDAPVLLADEPVAGVDPRHQLSILEHLRRWATNGRIVIVTLHDLNLALRYCDDTLLLTGDGQARFGATAAILTPETIREVFGVTVRSVTVEGRTTLVNWSLDHRDASRDHH